VFAHRSFFLFGVNHREHNFKGRTAARFTSRNEAAAVALYDFSANGQSHAGTFVNVSRMQALKHVEHAISVLFVEADTVILDDDAA